MTQPPHRDSARHETSQLATWAATLTPDQIPPPVADRLRLVLADTLTATLAGARCHEHSDLLAVWPLPDGGTSPLIGAGRAAPPETAGWLNAMAGVRLELDEGHKHTAGHPMAHVAHAVLATAAAHDIDGPRLLAAALTGYEVAARFGRATRLRAGTHPHGNWGVTGAAAGTAHVMGLSAEKTAAAVDTAAGMVTAGPFTAALDGNPVRDAWVGTANASGIAAARMAAAGMTSPTGTAASSLGGLLGELDPERLTESLGQRWEIAGNYFKRHACCSFTHPAIDAVLRLTDRYRLGTIHWADIDTVEVETHALAGGLDRTEWPNRLAALFSIPFAVGSALLWGGVRPADSEPDALADHRLRAISGKVRVVVSPDLTSQLPERRAARVRLTLADGRAYTAEVPNPVGDADHYPMDARAVRAKSATLLGQGTTDAMNDLVARLETAPSVRSLLLELAHL